MRRLLFLLLVTLLVGCAREATPVTQPASPPESAPAVAAPQRPPWPPPTSRRNVPPPPDYLSTAMVELESADLGVRLAYPENFEPPLGAELPPFQRLQLRFATGEINIYREERKPDATLESLAQEHIAVNTEMSHGRLAMQNLGATTLGGEEAWAVQHSFASAAGRTDGVLYFVLKGPFEYRVSCATKEGPPVEPWDEVRPICEQVLETIRFDP